MQSNNSTNILRMVTHSRGAEYVKLSEMPSGEFILLTQYESTCSSFTFPPETDDEVKIALRSLQLAMENANRKGSGGGLTNSMQRPHEQSIHE